MTGKQPGSSDKNGGASRDTRVLSVANQKGGVGKTTTAVNLGAALGELGFTVGIIDLDPQANATTGLGLKIAESETSLYDVLLEEAPIGECFQSTSFSNLSVAPATVDLAGVEVELVSAPEREFRLRQAVGRLGGTFDFLFIDCPPSLGLLTLNGLVAAREIMLPVQCEYYALEGVGQLIQNIELVRVALNPDLHLGAVLLTMYDARAKLSRQVDEDVRAHFGDLVCQTVIPRSVRLSEAPSFGQPITAFDPLSRGAKAYRDLAKEVVDGKA